jgi:alpha-glucosidase
VASVTTPPHDLVLRPVLHPSDSDAGREPAPWWRSAVIYQIYPRSFADSDGDGVGDLPGITGRLDHVAQLGADAIWLSPFYSSPQADAGYDVADYRTVDPVFGTLDDADALLARAHQLGLRVIVDVVPNHTSDRHPWFVEALASPAGSPARARYLFRDGTGRDGEQPPNHWRSMFGGSAWQRVTEPDGSPGQWYLHLFDVHQPDLDWTNLDVHAEFASILRFWLDRGADGFRIDVANGLVKPPGLPDWDRGQDMMQGAVEEDERPPYWDQDGVHEIYRAWHDVVAPYPGDRVLVAEAWVPSLERLARYVRPDELDQAFNFEYLLSPWRAKDVRDVITDSLEAMDSVGATTTWVLSNHDVIRHATRFGYPAGSELPKGIGADDPQPDVVLGLRRARAATLLMLALPGSAYLYQGEELGLPEHTTMPDDVRQDPTWARSGHTQRGRDGCRVPIPWEAGAPSCGFGPGPLTWLPQPDDWGRYALDRQVGVPSSTYELYRTALEQRAERELGAGSLAWLEGYDDDVVAFVNGRTMVVANLGETPVTLPSDVRVIVSSLELPDDGRGLVVPTDVTVWAERP